MFGAAAARIGQGRLQRKSGPRLQTRGPMRNTDGCDPSIEYHGTSISVAPRTTRGQHADDRREINALIWVLDDTPETRVSRLPEFTHLLAG